MTEPAITTKPHPQTETAEDAGRPTIKTLERVYLALQLLDEGSLGYGEDEASRWPLRDELMAEVDKRLIELRASPAPTGDDMGELVRRLRDAHPFSAQYAGGSNILIEAANAIDDLNNRLNGEQMQNTNLLSDLNAANSRFARLEKAAESFRMAVLESGALNHIPQSRYFVKLRELETALNPLNVSAALTGAGEK